MEIGSFKPQNSLHTKPLPVQMKQFHYRFSSDKHRANQISMSKSSAHLWDDSRVSLPWKQAPVWQKELTLTTKLLHTSHATPASRPPALPSDTDSPSEMGLFEFIPPDYFRSPWGCKAQSLTAKTCIHSLKSRHDPKWRNNPVVSY